MKKVILLAFDFDGTLVASEEEVLRALEFSCGKLKLEVPSRDYLRGCSARELVAKWKLRPWGVYRMLRHSRNYLRDSREEVKFYPGAKDLLRGVDASRFECHVVSTNSREKVERALTAANIRSCFAGIEGGVGLWSKRKVLLELYKKIRPARALYIGDEERDIACARSAGFESVAVGWGFKSPAFLQSQNPTYFTSDVAQLDRLLRTLSASMLAFLLFLCPSLHAEDIGTAALPLPPVVEYRAKANIDMRSSLRPLDKIPLANADLVFIRSTSSQAKALEEVTRSHWTHVGVLFRAQKMSRGDWKLIDESAAGAGAWYVLEAGPVVRFTELKKFVGTRAHAVLRLKRKLTRDENRAIYEAGLSRLGKYYDTFFLLSLDGKTKDDKDYCSELVWYMFAKGIKTALGERVVMGSMDQAGTEAKKLIEKRFANHPPLSLAEWKRQFVIPPQSQFDSPFIERIDL